MLPVKQDEDNLQVMTNRPEVPETRARDSNTCRAACDNNNGAVR